MIKSRSAALAVALLVLAAAQLRATVFIPVELGELVLAARAVAHGRIVDLRPQVSADHRHVDTLVTLDVATYLKGNLGPSVTFRVPGGQIGRYRTVVIDAPHFTLGEEVVLLFGSRGPSIPYVLGMNQGVFRVVSDLVTAERRVLRAPLLGEGADWTPVVRGDPSHEPLLLTDFASRVRRIVERER